MRTFCLDGFITEHSNYCENKPFSLIILNNIENECKHDNVILNSLWNRSQEILVLDGGMNYIYKTFKEDEIFKKNLKLIGDLDSINQEIYEKIKDKIIVIKDEDQNRTDLGKGIRSSANTDVVIFGGIRGRFDHTMNALHLLYKFPMLNLVIISDGNLILLVQDELQFLLQGSTKGYFGKHCGIIPLIHDSTVCTKGLEWELDKTNLCIGKMLSTSNRFKSDIVYISCSSPCIFTAEMVI